MSEHSWEETKRILDDPYVSADTKQQVLAAYSRDGGGFNDEAAEYYEKYDVPRYSFSDGPLVEVVDEAAYEQAKEESEDEGYRDRQVQDEVNQNRSELNSLRAPSPGSGGVKNSDELFDLAERALEVFKNFLPIDKEAPDQARHLESPKEFDKDIKEPFDQQRGIDFGKFLEEAGRLRDAHSTLKELHGTTESSLNSLYKDWTGEGANASYRQYSEDIAPNAQELLEYLDGAAQIIESAVQTVYEACKNKADEVLSLYTLTVGSAVPETAKQVMKLARGDFSSQDEVLPVAAWVDAECGTNIESTIRSDDCGLNDENKQMVEEECRKWIRDSWNTDLWDNLYSRFKEVCEHTKESVDSAWEEMDNYLKEYKSEFPEGTGNSNVPPPTEDPGGSQTPDSSQPPGAGGGGTGAGTGGGGTGGGGTPPTPEVETPKPEDANTPGKNPVTGEDLEVNPETGEPYPIDPETGEAIKDVGDDQDTVTVEKGDHKLEMTEPDADGQMEISVDDGSGQPKDYKLDFGDGEQGAGGQQGQGEGQGGGQGQNEGGGFGPQGGGGSSGGDQQVHRPGPDGKIHIQDGNLTITAEQPEGPDGPTKVTVDDGNPPPTTYTLGQNKQEPEAGATDGAGGGSERENISTMPAYEDNPFTSGNDGTGVDGADGAGGDGDGGQQAGGASTAGGGSGDAGIPAGGDGASADAPGGGGPTGEPSGGSGGNGESGDSGGTQPQASASGGSGGGGESGGAGGGVSSAVGAGGDSLGAGAETGAATQSAPVTAGVGAAPGGTGEPMGASSSSQGSGGMGMMGGGMGAMGGAGGGQGGDQERSSNPYRIEGGIFGNSGGGNRISGSLEDDADRSVRFDR